MQCGSYYLEIADHYGMVPVISNLPKQLADKYAMFKSALVPPPHMKSTW